MAYVWLTNNGIPHKSHLNFTDPSTPTTIYEFENLEDATWFALKWG